MLSSNDVKRLGALVLIVLAGCGAGSESSGGGGGGTPVVESLPPKAYGLSLRVVDEAGTPLPGADVTVGDLPFTSDANGRVAVGGLVEPVIVVARAPGRVPEPCVMGPDEEGVEQVLRLRSTSGPLGPRVALHFGGDVMMGRRYVAPTLPDTHVLTPGDGGASARAGVSSIAPLFRAADVRMANIETAIGTLPDSAAYPGKRFLLQSPPELVDALVDMGLDVGCLANNHIRDWLDPGITSTIAALRARNIATAGAGADEAEAALPAVVNVAGTKVGVLAYCEIRGNSVNDAYPDESVPAPSDGDPKFAFKYESRLWGYSEGPVNIPEFPRRIKSAWLAIKAAEEDLDLTKSQRADLWTSAVAVYPELQDWVARRGHGGANETSFARMKADVKALRAQGCALVAVMLHNGHEYAEFRSESTVQDTHNAVEAGADVVVTHHGHVQQGFEFYKGKLICLGLGNCVFDQDFLSTMLTGVLRVVFEGDTLIEARYFPMTLLGYRPAPLAGAAARNLTRLLQERSAIDARTNFYGPVVKAVPMTSDPLTDVVAFRFDRNAAVLTPWTGATGTLDVVATRAAVVDLPPLGLTRSRAAAGNLSGLQFGRDIFRWGSFEDEVGDGAAAGGPHWRLETASSSAGVPVLADAPSGTRALKLMRSSGNTSRVRLRPRSLVSRLEHRLWNTGGATPADGPPTYTLRFKARRTGAGAVAFTLDAYNFSTSFADGPDTLFVRSVELPFAMPAGDAWNEFQLELPAVVFAPFGPFEANAVMIYVNLYPPAEGVTEFWMDDLQLLEWRDPEAMPDAYYEVNAVRAKLPGPPVAATLTRRPE